MQTLTQSIVRELLDYDPVSGKLTWKERSAKWFKDIGSGGQEGNSSRWNGNYAGKETFNYVSKTGYYVGRILGKDYKKHRIIWLYEYGFMPKIIDHIDGNKLNNSLDNLREVSQQENLRNSSIRKDNLSGSAGVSFFPLTNKWRSYINKDGKQIHLGYYENKEDAILTYNNAKSNLGFTERHGK